MSITYKDVLSVLWEQSTGIYLLGYKWPENDTVINTYYVDHIEPNGEHITLDCRDVNADKKDLFIKLMFKADINVASLDRMGQQINFNLGYDVDGFINQNMELSMEFCQPDDI